jgi:hypothetical protein
MGYTKEPGIKLNRKQNKPFRLISPENEVVTFKNQQNAAEYIGCYSTDISKLLKGKRIFIKRWKLYPLDGIFGFVNENQKI